MGKGQALANQPYQAYTGPLTAGPSALQSQAFQGLGNLAMPSMGGFTPQSFASPMGGQPTLPSTGPFTEPMVPPAPMGGQPTLPSTGVGGEPMVPPAPPPVQPSGIASAYMNPYLREALDPQLRELQRQQEIRRIENAGRLTKAGAFGGGRQAVMESELDRAYMDKAADITGRGYQDAYTKAMQQFNVEQDRAMKAQELSNRYGLDALRQQLAAGATEQDITEAGIAADKKQFEEERDFPYKQLQYQKSLLQGLPLTAQNYGYADASNLMKILAGASALTGGSGTKGGGIANVLKGATDYFKNLIQGQNPSMSEAEFEDYWSQTEGGLFDEVGMTPEEWYGPGGGFMGDGDVPYSDYFPLFEPDNDYSSYF